MTEQEFVTKTKSLIDGLKSVCANYGLGNDASEFNIITQVFLYKYLNDKFIYEAKKANPKLAKAENFQEAYEALSESEQKFLMGRIGTKAAKIKPEQMISYVYNKNGAENFAEIYFDGTLRGLNADNEHLYAVKSEGGGKEKMFDDLSQYIRDFSQRDAFCKALLNKIVDVSFEKMFSEKYDFFSTIFEYLIKDYNSDSGGKYAEYYTPHAVARIMAAILVTEKDNGVKVYDPSAGSGTLLMNIAHAIGEKNCSIYSEDVSQKSANMLRLNLIINNLSHSIPNIIKGNTILSSSYLAEKFDYIVSNPPFKLDFSDYQSKLLTDTYKTRFFAGVPKIPAKDKDKMAIYLLFIQHIMHSLSEKGKAAIVVPTGFITAQSGIEKKIREALIERGWLRGVVSMPSNIFASTGTNVSILFFDKKADNEHIVLMDASKLGETVKEGKNQRTVLTHKEETRIVETFNNKEAIEDLSAIVTKEQIKEKNYSFSAGQYFEVKIEYSDITTDEFHENMKSFEKRLNILFTEGKRLDNEIEKQLKGLKYE
ncbi:HsdM family class I SAM-dependent methyltransferase [Chryseobacterium sp. MIQD13]|uniref:HsdM family class I SAM-dependent methyltransferase n=1 Tax=Chryseobacterium sp. MIQD13 TaxID=3422310 RepID=UPI003D283146